MTTLDAGDVGAEQPTLSLDLLIAPGDSSAPRSCGAVAHEALPATALQSRPRGGSERAGEHLGCTTQDTLRVT
eukprot:CAMPEP_0175770734 /NCGR_PEP_ID=MMETSP0097-20121207/71660_1 /TAXON_ID=311494 /ORGANISM="Alexandrium monilatum, Strain CCMP3105" /LENGTH=72 /DNA_ID=CAMNT_0017081013 /DNA_START=79 /DNA_END=294 /DNA_ORIENTATION=+